MSGVTSTRVVEVGDWQHECCGPSYERGSTVEITCLVVSGADGTPDRYVETHHELTSRHPVVTVRGRVADLHIQHPDGSTEPLLRLRGGKALRGYDETDDGHLDQAWTGAPVTCDSHQFFLTVAT